MLIIALAALGVTAPPMFACSGLSLSPSHLSPETAKKAKTDKPADATPGSSKNPEGASSK
jgi:hypothetical protein